MTIHIEKERAAFEVAARASKYACYSFAQFGNGVAGDATRYYLDTKTEAAWEVWQARATIPPTTNRTCHIDANGATRCIGCQANHDLNQDHGEDCWVAEGRAEAAPTARQQAALQALVDQAQELDMGYGPAAPVRAAAEIAEASAPAGDAMPALANPCGGCGERDPDKRCIGCGHIFRPTPTPKEK